MGWSEDFELLGNRDREEFRRVVNRLLGQTFIVRSEENRRDFFFVDRYHRLIQQYLQFSGWSLVVNRADGVAQAINGEGGTRLAMRLWDSVLLLIIRLLYEEKQQELHLGQIVCKVADVQAKCLTLRLTKNGVFVRRNLKEAFGLFRRYSLVQVVDADVLDPECKFVIYPSVKYAVSIESIKALSDLITSYGKEEAEDEAADGP